MNVVARMAALIGRKKCLWTGSDFSRADYVVTLSRVMAACVFAALGHNLAKVDRFDNGQ